MERILVSMEGRTGAWEALTRAISLAKRIAARLFVLRVLKPSEAKGGGRADARLEEEVRRKLELLIEAAKADGVLVDYFVTEGVYQDEVVRFVEHNRITLLVAENGECESRSHDREPASICALMHRVSCRVELVSPRKTESKP